ncbi:MAG: glycosyltransferase [Ferruginibacter sp.]
MNAAASPLRVLFECRSIEPDKSGGIENYVYMLVNGWLENYPADTVLLNIPPGTRIKYEKKIGPGAILLTDPVYARSQKYLLRKPWLKRLVHYVSKVNIVRRYIYGLRPGWIASLDKKADAVICPFQREEILHDPRKVIFVMHDFRMWDLPGGDKKTMRNQHALISSSAFTVCCWPYPFRRLNEEFGVRPGKFYEIPFLFDNMETAIPGEAAEDFLYYPGGLGEHKNHSTLIKGLALYNKTNDRKLKLVCTGTEIPALKKNLELLIEELGVGSDIIFMGFVDRDEVFSLYQRCLAVITSTLYEAVSGAIVEAYRFQKPVLASGIPPHTDFVKKYQLKLELFDPLNPESIAHSIEKLNSSYPQLVKASVEGKRSLSFITEKYTVSAFRELCLKVKAGQAN